MQKLLWVGNHFFRESLKALGIFEVINYDFNEHKILTWEDLVSICKGEPDILLVADKSLPPFILGMEDFPCLTIFYAVDSHLQSWYPYYAQGFDLCLLSLKDHLKNFEGPFLPKKHIFWSPPFAQDHQFRDLTKERHAQWDCIFVGRVNANTPKRQVFMEALKTKLPNFYVTFGDFVTLFPKAKVVLNFCEHGDLNFRVFEAQGMGSALVTPRIKNGQDSLFQNRTHYLLYEVDSLTSCLEAILELLEDANLRQRLEEEGLKKINAAHRATHRAQNLVKILKELEGQIPSLIKKRLSQAKMIRRHSLRLPYLLWAKEFTDLKSQELFLKAASQEGLKIKR